MKLENTLHYFNYKLWAENFDLDSSTFKGNTPTN